MSARASALRSGILVFAATLAVDASLAPPAHAGWREVSVSINLPPKIDTEPEQPVLVARMRANGHEFLDVGLEVSRWVRREIGRETSLTALDVRPPPIPEQRPQQLAANDRFWRRLGEDFDADLIVGGIVSYASEDRSGFVNEDVISPVTRQTVRRTRFQNMRGYRLQLEVFFFKGDNGALLHHDIWKKELLASSDQTPDELTVLYELLESMKDDLLAVLLPTKLRQPRYIWV
ncbi:MAG: hypothetical protein OEQ13_09530, partial [Acidobacteriota bacterium]|nr:hypothetical protein [Acidobacteriota bacterium]